MKIFWQFIDINIYIRSTGCLNKFQMTGVFDFELNDLEIKAGFLYKIKNKLDNRVKIVTFISFSYYFTFLLKYR